jgi:Ca2+-binding RTX toxin-like protein
MNVRIAVTTAIVVAAALAASVDRAAASSTVALEHGTLTVKGDAANDRLALRALPSAPRALEVDLGDDGTADAAIKLRKVERIRVGTGGGDDAVRLDESSLAFTDRVPTTMIGGADFDDVRGNKGDDVVDLGADADRFIWNPGDGSDVVDGQGGHDVLFFFGTNDAETLDLSAQGRRLRLSRDVENVVMELEDIDEINPVVNGGADTIAVGDLSATGVDEVNVNLEPGLGTPGATASPTA